MPTLFIGEPIPGPDLVEKEESGKIEEAVERSLRGPGFELVDLEFHGEHKGLVLRIFIDKEGGVTIDDCVVASEVVGRDLDSAKLIGEPYQLEVSSPGIERRLKKAEDFKRFIGSRVKVKIVKPVAGRRNFSGVLKKAGESGFIIDADGQLFNVLYEELDKAHLLVDIKI
jgi:ribosome maturation factor RimP